MDISKDVILGIEFLRKHNVSLDVANLRMSIGDTEINVILAENKTAQISLTPTMKIVPYTPPIQQQDQTKTASIAPKEKTHSASNPPEISEDDIQVESVPNPESDPESEDEDCYTPPTTKKTPPRPEVNKQGTDQPTRSPLRDLD